MATPSWTPPPTSKHQTTRGAHPHTLQPPAVNEVADARWLDRLVELHVLAEHGDPVSAEVADQWIASDVEAREVWLSVERVRDRVRAADSDPSYRL